MSNCTSGCRTNSDCDGTCKPEYIKAQLEQKVASYIDSQHWVMGDDEATEELRIEYAKELIELITGEK